MNERTVRRLCLLLLHITIGLVIFLNFPFTKQLIGWDSLNPELNFLVNFKHVLTPFWQENQGLGLLAGHGFAAVLPHNIVILLLSIVVPPLLVRTVFTFLCFYVGGIGMFILLEAFLKKVITNHKIVSCAALLGALYYLFNFGTTQMFYIQLEAFIMHFAVLPWLFWIAYELLEHGVTRKKLVLFGFINFWAIGQGFIPPLFVAYSVALGFFLLVYLLYHRRSLKQAIKKILLIVGLTVVINAFWLLPLGYYTVTRSGVYLDSYNNLASTPEFVQKNKKYGDISDVPLIKGFMVEAVDSTSNGNIQFVLQSWVTHHQNTIVVIIGYVFFALAVLGLVAGFLMWRMHWMIVAFGVVFVFFFTGITTDFPPFSFLTHFLQEYMPIYRQAFRAAFTKFSIGVAFSYALFVAIGCAVFLEKIFKHKKIRILSIVIGCFGILFFAFPNFTGNFFYPRLLQKLPQAYLNVIDYFKTQPDGRIADFPQECPEGWFTYNWGYTGSGFYWYGVKQPILSRTFDVWSNYNENYYWEVSQALRERDMLKVQTILQKYDVTWIMYDENVLHCRSQKGFASNTTFLHYIQKSTDYTLVKKFVSPSIQPIWIFRRKTDLSSSYVNLVKDINNVGPAYKWTDNDQSYLDFGNYLTDTKENYDVFYPFRSIFSKRNAQQNEFSVEENVTDVRFKAQLPQSMFGSFLHIPPLQKLDRIIFASINTVNERGIAKISIDYSIPKLSLDGKSVGMQPAQKVLATIPFNKTKDLLQIMVNGIEYSQATPTAILFTDTNNTIDVLKNNKVVTQWASDDDVGFQTLINQETTVKIPKSASGNLEVSTLRVPSIPELYYSVQAKDARPEPCNELVPSNRNKHDLLNFQGKEYLRLASTDSRQCVIFHIPDFSTSVSYLMKVSHRSVSGNNLLMYLSNEKKVHYLDLYLYGYGQFHDDYLAVPATFKDGRSYDLYFDNFSEDRDATINDLSGVEMFAFPYKYLTSLQITKTQTNNVAQQEVLLPDMVKHPFDTNYLISTESGSKGTSILVLNQSFDSSWKAYAVPDAGIISTYFPFFSGKELTNHVLVNNWANGWEINGEQNIAIVFWPQYLEYIGFGLFFSSLLFILLYPSKRKVVL